MRIENEIPGITQEDIHVYDEWILNTKKEWEEANPGQIFKAHYNRQILRNFVQERMDIEDKEAEVIEDLMQHIDQQAKQKLDVRLASGEISVAEYQKIIRALAWSHGQKRNEGSIGGKDKLYRKHLDSIGKRDPRIGRAEQAIHDKRYEEIDSAQQKNAELKYKSESVTNAREQSEENQKMLERRIEGLKKQDSIAAKEELAELLGEKNPIPQPPPADEIGESGEGRLEVPDDLEAQAEEIIRLNGIAAKESQEQNRKRQEDAEKLIASEELDAMVFKNGLVLAEYLEPKWMELDLSPEARAFLSNLRKMYRSLNQGCSCTRQKRAKIVEQGYQKSVSELAKSVGIIDAVKKASGKSKVVFFSDGQKILEE